MKNRVKVKLTKKLNDATKKGQVIELERGLAARMVARKAAKYLDDKEPETES